MQEAEAGELPQIQIQIGLHNYSKGILNFIARLCSLKKKKPTKVKKKKSKYDPRLGLNCMCAILIGRILKQEGH